jgi:hypothetical protein
MCESDEVFVMILDTARVSRIGAYIPLSVSKKGRSTRSFLLHCERLGMRIDHRLFAGFAPNLATARHHAFAANARLRAEPKGDEPNHQLRYNYLGLDALLCTIVAMKFLSALVRTVHQGARAIRSFDPRRGPNITDEQAFLKRHFSSY